MARSPWPDSARTTPLPHCRCTTVSPGARSRSSAPRCWSARRSAGVEARLELRAGGPGAEGVAAGAERGARVAPLRGGAAEAAGGAGGRGDADQLLGDLLEEARGQVVIGGAEQRPAPGIGEVQALAGTGDAHVGEPSLLLQVARLTDRTDVREDVLLQADDEHHRVLEALGGVQRHQGDRLAGRLDLVGVRDQRDRLEEAGQSALWLAQLVLLGN